MQSKSTGKVLTLVTIIFMFNYSTMAVSCCNNLFSINVPLEGYQGNREITINSNDDVFSQLQGTWKNMSPKSAPNPRYMHAMAYDSDSDRAILFGGNDEYSSLFNNDTWTYDYNNNTWKEINPLISPSPRDGHRMVYDSKSDVIILFGGQVRNYSYSNETWSYNFNTNTWLNMSPVQSPTLRRDSGMVYDTKIGRTVLFGGGDGYNVYNDTWTYDFSTNNWTNLRPVISPPKRDSFAMSYDSKSDNIILFGGDYYTNFFGDTWTYNYATNVWTNMTPSISPRARALPSMAYDSEYDLTILFGGQYWFDSTSLISDTWSYDFHNDSWKEIKCAISPSPRVWHAMVYDSKLKLTILFGGALRYNNSNETWSFQIDTGDNNNQSGKNTSTGYNITIVQLTLASGIVICLAIGVLFIFVRKRKRRKRPKA